MPINLKRTGIKFDATHRNDTNDNWTAIEKAVAGVEDVVSESFDLAQEAMTKATDADNKAELTQSQLDTLILESGTSDAETIQARGGEDLLYKRLDKTDQQLADKVTKGQLKGTDFDTSSNAYKLKPINISDELMTMFSPAGAVSPVIPNGGLVREKYANNSIGLEKVDFVKRGKNLFNKATISPKGMWKHYSTGNIETYPTNPSVQEYHYTDFIPVNPETTYVVNATISSYLFYDASYTRIGGAAAGGARTIVTPINCAFVILNIIHPTVDSLQLELGTTSTAYENFFVTIPLLNINEDVGKAAEVVIKLEPFKEHDVLLKTGNIVSNRDQISTFTGFAYPFNIADFQNPIYGIRMYVCIGTLTDVPSEFVILDSNKVKIKKYAINIPSTGHVEIIFPTPVELNELTQTFYVGISTVQEVRAVLVPPNVTKNPSYDTRGVKSLYSTDRGITWVEVTSGYEGEVELLGDYSFVFNNEDPLNDVKLSLPNKYELVVGDTFELFYKGILLSNNPYNYNFKIICAKGNAYSKRYIFTPVLGDVGTHTMTVSVYNDNQVLLDSKNVNLVVKNKAISPSTPKNVLSVGDSLTAGGQWVSETYRRLTGSGGTPPADGLTNINFIGSVNGTGGAKYVGYGGWTYTNYNTNNLPPNYWATVTSGMKTNVVSQQSIWVDANGKQWQLETLDTANSKLKFKQYPAGSNNVLPTSGTLTFVSGGGDTTPIIFNSAIAEASNPFWIGGKVDFLAYAQSIGASSIDHCYILLGWNSTTNSETTVKNDVRTFINNLRTSFPNSKVTLLGLQVPSQDGLGANYGASASWNYMDKLKAVFNFNKWYSEVAAEFTNVDFINIAGQFDSENNMPEGTRPVNVRNTRTETYGINGVHPDTEGYMQLADAVYRNLSHKI